MLNVNQESIQLLNTAIIKSKEKRIDTKFEERLSNVCKQTTIQAITIAVNHLSQTEKISRDQAAILIIETIRDLEKNWTDYLLMEGIGKIKENLKGNKPY